MPSRRRRQARVSFLAGKELKLRSPRIKSSQYTAPQSLRRSLAGRRIATCVGVLDAAAQFLSTLPSPTEVGRSITMERSVFQLMIPIPQL